MLAIPTFGLISGECLRFNALGLNTAELLFDKERNGNSGGRGCVCASGCDKCSVLPGIELPSMLDRLRLEDICEDEDIDELGPDCSCTLANTEYS